ncbi:unnamed protein product [Dibothriocephalus latus]|uniref:Sodium/calcium exchanger membrane region domain-containing protein n=1 Tax=Dibothriocephalus latus TaxID=60516 RepID=A0A3P6URT0_DIBLA|nr:unnamed protein product [Dibothriocephalus latus]
MLRALREVGWFIKFTMYNLCSLLEAWLLPNKEAEEKELAGSTNSIYEWESAMDEKMRDAAVQSEFKLPSRLRHCSDSTQIPEISAIFNSPRDTTHGSHTPSVSFLGKSPASSTNRSPNNLHPLHRVSSTSLPDLDQLTSINSLTPHSILIPRASLLKQDIGGHPTDLRVQFEVSPIASILGRPSALKESIAEEEAEEYEENEELEEEEEEEEMAEEEEEDDAFMKWGSKGMWHHLLYSLSPIDFDEWKRISLPMKLLQILQAPLFLLFRITIPVVIEDLEPAPPAPPASAQPTDASPLPASNRDLEAGSFQGAANRGGDESISGSKLSMTTVASESYISFRGSENVSPPVVAVSADGPEPSPSPSIPESSDGLMDFEQLHGWCRLLNCFQCLLTPMLWVMLITIGGKSLGLHKINGTDMPVVVIVLLISTCLAITIFVTSHWDRPPAPYHRPFFATLGFLTSVIWIYAIAHELVNSLETLGIVWEISEAILGISVMALASSIGGLDTTGTRDFTVCQASAIKGAQNLKTFGPFLGSAGYYYGTAIVILCVAVRIDYRP